MKPFYLLLVLATLVGCTTMNSPHFRNSELPSYVQEIEFPGATLRANTSVSFGAWTVRYNNGSLPIIVGYNGMAIYTIHNLTAHNDVAGDFPCMIYYMDGATFGAQKRGFHDYQWNLGILTTSWDPSNQVSDYNHPNFYKIISLPFPTGIRLKQ
ncbi:MAG TPA: hypothetical protein VI298_13840 [Geobacteraceae bacterium]